MSIQTYQAEHDGQMPPDLQTVYDWPGNERGFGAAADLLSCPRLRRNPYTLFVTTKLHREAVDPENIDETSSYHYGWIKSTENPTVPLPLLWDKSPHRYGYNVLYPDGHVETIAADADEFEAFLEENAEYYH